MAPRKAARSSAGATPSALPPLPHSAARETLHIPELRQRILRLLAPADLTRVMRTEKGVMADVAKELYHSMPYAHVRNKMTVSTPRQRTYCNAVTEIDARNTTLSAAMLKGIKISTRQKPTPSDISWYLQTYHVEVMELLLPILQKKCPNLRRILFGGDHAYDQTDSWTVHLDPMNPGTGRIALRFTLCGFMEVDCPLTTPPLPSTPQHFTLDRHFDMHLYHARDTEKWLQAFKEKPYFAELGATAHFGRLPVSLDDISCLYRLQVESESTCRMKHIEAAQCPTYSISDLYSFAQLTSTSLSTLHLTDTLKNGNPLQHPLSFTDLPELFTILQSLPNLVDLALTLGSVEEAEIVSKALLTKDSLEVGGSIEKLHIVTEAHPAALFNTLRCLAGLCDTERESFAVTVGSQFGGYIQGQAEFVRYLRKQPRERRSHLAIADFTQLGYAKLAELPELSYHDDGRPRNKAETSAARWTKEAQTAAVEVPTRLIPNLEDAVSDYAKASEELERVVAEGTPAERLEAAQKFMTAVIHARFKATVVQMSTASPKTVEQVREYIASLKRTTEAS